MADKDQSAGGESVPLARYPAAPPVDALPHVEGYQIHSRLGEGGMGVVWAGVQLSTKQKVAIKLLNGASFGSTRAKTRFAREVELAASLTHPNIARIFASGLDQGIWYYAMELIDGVPLDQFAAQKKLSGPEKLELMRRVCLAMQHAHQRGVIHRDLKPSNILVSSDGQPHILDFGLAKDLSNDANSGVTIVGDVSGTPAYMSPEQASGNAATVDTRSDVYSLGVILYTLLTAKTPHDLSGTHVAVIRRIAEEDVIRPRVADTSVDSELEAVLLKSLARNPEDRYASAADLAEDIERYLHGEPITARPATMGYFLSKWLRKRRVPVGIAAAVSLLLLAAAVWAYARIATAEQNARTALTDLQASQHGLVEQTHRADDQADAAVAARKQAETALADSYAARGSEHSDWNAISSLWFAKAAESSPDDHERAETNLLRARNFLADQWSPVAAVPTHNNDMFAFDPNSHRYLITYSLKTQPPAAPEVWDLAMEQPLALPDGFTALTAAAWGPKDQLLAGSDDGQLALVSVPSMKIVRHWTLPGPVRTAAASASGEWVAASVGAKLLVFSGDESGAPAVFDHPSDIAYISFAQTTATLVTATPAENAARVFQVSRNAQNAVVLSAVLGPVNHVFGGQHQYWVFPPVISPDGSKLITIDSTASANAPGRFEWHDVKTGQLLGAVNNSDEYMHWFSIGSPNPAAETAKIVYELGVNNIRAFDIQTRAEIQPARNEDPVFKPDPLRQMIYFSEDRARFNYLRPGGLDKTGQFIARGVIRCAQQSSDAQFLGVADDNEVFVFAAPAVSHSIGVAAAAAEQDIPLNKRGSWVAFSSDGKYLAPIGTTDGAPGVSKLVVHRLGGVHPIVASMPLNGMLASAAFSPQGDRMVYAFVGGGGRQFGVWNWQSEQASWTPIDLPVDPIWVAWSPLGDVVAVHCIDGSVLLVDPGSGAILHHLKCAATLKGPRLATWGSGTIAFSVDGRTVFTWGSPIVQAWDISTGTERYRLSFDEDCTSLERSKDGALVAAGSMGGSLRIFRSDTGQLTRPPLKLPTAIWNIAFSADGERLCTIELSSVARVWDVASGEMRLAIGGSQFGDARFTLDGQFIVTASGPQHQIWSAATGIPITPPIVDVAHESVTMSPDGKWAATAGSGHWISLDDLTTLTHADNLTLQDVTQWSELASCSRIKGATTVTLTDEEWLDRWHAYRAAHPEYRPFAAGTPTTNAN